MQDVSVIPAIESEHRKTDHFSSQAELQTTQSSSGSYDENDFVNYIEDRQQCLRGDEPNPEFTNHHVFSKPKRKKNH